MRFFIALDPASIIKPADVRRILEEHRSRDEYEVLPLHGEGFPIRRIRKNAKAIKVQACREAEKILQHYQDATFCVVVYRSIGKVIQGEVREDVPIDCALVVRSDLTSETCVLNDAPDDTRYESWMPNKPHLLGALMEFSLMHLAGKYADA